MEDTKYKNIRPYDFRSPQKISKDKIDLLRTIYSNYANMITTKMALTLKIPCKMYLNNIEESEFSKYSSGVSNHVITGVYETQYVNGETSDKYSTITIPRDLLYIIIDRLSGGSGEPFEVERGFTDLELEIIYDIYKEAIAVIGEVHHGYIDIKTECSKTITKSEFSGIINYNEKVIVMTFAIEINGNIGNVQICLPHSIVMEIYNKMNEYSFKQKDNIKRTDKSKKGILGYLNTSKLDLIGQLGCAELTLQDIADMQIGDILVLDNISDDAVTIKVGQEDKFKGGIGSKNGNYAIRINKLLNKGGADDGKE